MKEKARLEALARVAAMKKEADMMAVARADAERSQVKARIDALDNAAMASRQTPAMDIASLAAQDSFGRLVINQRAGLDSQLAEKTGLWRARRDAAALSFGRSQVLDSLRERIVARTVKRRGDDTF